MLNLKLEKQLIKITNQLNRKLLSILGQIILRNHHDKY